MISSYIIRTILQITCMRIKRLQFFMSWYNWLIKKLVCAFEWIEHVKMELSIISGISLMHVFHPNYNKTVFLNVHSFLLKCWWFDSDANFVPVFLLHFIFLCFLQMRQNTWSTYKALRRLLNYEIKKWQAIHACF